MNDKPTPRRQAVRKRMDLGSILIELNQRLPSWKGPPGIKKRDRPAIRWVDDIEEVAGKTWMNTINVEIIRGGLYLRGEGFLRY
ncbi:hypothetical protein EVAR_83428_1 [Eumeta japonica]|uniref:Uncharacterized protein n=1 Tax=Eumeta variegata TaxID=151549 RepID=A0A4C1TYI4_EUMVA|nr:hypothetical protein EVAR_83428_1 [Eumeta japonica]